MQEKRSPFGKEKDIYFMQQALRLAEKAFQADEVPIGSIVVNAQGKIIGRGFNIVEQKNTQVAHAEMLALQKAGAKNGDWRLEECWLYVTLEPCAMCMHMSLLSRIEGIVFGARSPLFGFHLDNSLSLALYKKSAPTIIEGVCADEAALLLKRFFQTKRKKR
jgi:tRNA(adenine34) deaminase